jgi:hypothetical protein
MELSKYIGKNIKVDLSNGYFYYGIVLEDTTNEVLAILDRKGNFVTIKETVIDFIREVKE